MMLILLVLLVIAQRSVSFIPSFTPKFHIRARAVQYMNTAPTTALVEDNLRKQIYCNVALNGTYIDAVGFDLDYTLVQVIYRDGIF